MSGENKMVCCFEYQLARWIELRCLKVAISPRIPVVQLHLSIRSKHIMRSDYVAAMTPYPDMTMVEHDCVISSTPDHVRVP